MILLAHHEQVACLVVAALTMCGPALLAFRCWLWDRKHYPEDHNDGEHQH